MMATLRTIIKEKIAHRVHWWTCIRTRKRFTDSDIKKKEPNIKDELLPDEVRHLRSLYGKALSGGDFHESV